VLRYGGVKALTKHLHDDALKMHLTLEDPKVEVVPKMIDNRLLIRGTHINAQPNNNLKINLAKPKVAAKKSSRLEKATRHLYDLEAHKEPEKHLNIDLDLYQMENF
jgi:hypothetical protein